MALVAVDSFAPYNGVAASTLTAPSVQTKWTPSGGTTGVSMVTGLLGSGQALRQTASLAVPGQSFERPFTAARANGANGFAVRVTGIGAFLTQPSACAVIGLMRVGLPQFLLYFLPNGAISIARAAAYNSQGAAALATSPLGGWIINGTRHFIEIEWLISATVGAVTIYVDGVAALTATGLNNKGASTIDTSCDGFRVIRPLDSAGTTTVDVDSYYEADTNTRIGEMRVDALAVNSDSSIQFTNSAGSGTNFSKVNEAPSDGDTTYVQDSTVGHQDLYGVTALSGSPIIFGVQASSMARKTDATARTFGNTIKSSTTTENGASFSLATAYAKFEHMAVNDPATSATWLYTAVNAALTGPRVVS